MKNKHIKVLCFQICTPKLNTVRNSYDDTRYDFNEFDLFLDQILKQPLNDRGWDFDGKFMVLEKCHDSADSNYYEGFFTSGRYGQVSDYRHRKTFARRKSNKTVDEGEENLTYFVLEKGTGKLFLQSDGQRLVTKNAVDKYLRSKLDLFEPHIPLINKKISPLMITDRNFFVIKTIYTDDFFREISMLMRIKKAELEIKYDVDVNNKVIQELRNQATNITGASNFKYAVINKERGGSLGRVEEFIKYIEEVDKYENILVEGTNQAGRNKTVKLEDHAKDFDVKVKVNENGIISDEDLISGIIEFAKRDV